MIWNRTRDIKRRTEWLASQTFVVLSIQVPKQNEKNAASAEQFFAALHGIYRSDPIAQEHLSFEIVGSKEAITFYVFTPLHLRDFIEGQLYAQYPDLDIKQVPDYTRNIHLEGMHVAATKVQLTKEDVYPIKTFTTTEIDPLASITAVLSGLGDDEHVWFQMVTRPVGDEWQNKGVDYVQAIRAGHTPNSSNSVGSTASKAGRLALRVIQEIIQQGAGLDDSGKASSEPPKLSAPQEAALKGIESKITKLGFETVFRLVVIGPDITTVRTRTQSVLAALKQYNTTNLNGFVGGEIRVDDFNLWQKFLSREFEEKGNILNIEELASVYHFPMQSVESSAISWAGSKKGDAPFNLPLRDETDPKDLTVIGRTDFRNTSKEFGIKLDDRKRHIYVIGKSGTGKSTLLENMIIGDVQAGRGVVVVDPHGELADKVVESIPEHRIKDVIILDPADREFPIAFNLLEHVGDDFKGMVASGFVGIFKKIFGNSWGPRLEYILRNTVLALLDSENATMLGIPRMLTEPAFREQITTQVKDTVIRDYWQNEFAAMDVKQRTEAISPILNKVGQFLSTSTIRNIVGQPKSTIDIRRIMDEQKILIVNLSKGKIGEDNMALLGAMIITKVQLAAMSRANVAASERPDCFLYVDEFQNFATESFASILSEARKYNLGLTIAHQYIAQMVEEVKDAVIGNVGTMITFRVGAPDAEALVKEFAPVFDANDLVNLQKAHVYVKLLIDGIAAPAFSAQTLPPIQIDTNFRDQVIAFSRDTYAKPRDFVEDMIDETAGYKQKREHQEAVKQAQEVLKQGNAAVGIRPAAVLAQPPIVLAPKPVVVATPQPAPVIVAPPEAVKAPEEEQKPNIAPIVDQAPVLEPVEQGMEEEMTKIPKKPKPLKVIEGWAYKEVAQRGGMKWYLGEKEADVLVREEQKRILKEQTRAAKLTEQEGSLASEILSDEQLLPQIFEQPASPALASPPEQRAIEEQPVAMTTMVPVTPPFTAVLVQKEESAASLSLQEGQSIKL